MLVEWFSHRASVFKIRFETRRCHCIISLSLSTLQWTSIPSNYWQQKYSQLFQSSETEVSSVSLVQWIVCNFLCILFKHMCIYHIKYYIYKKNKSWKKNFFSQYNLRSYGIPNEKAFDPSRAMCSLSKQQWAHMSSELNFFRLQLLLN